MRKSKPKASTPRKLPGGFHYFESRRGGYQPAGDSHRESCGTTCRNVPCFDIIPPNFVCKCSILHCWRLAPTLFPQRGNNRAANSRPYADVPHRTWCVICGWLKIFEFVGVVLRNFHSVIRWHRLRRGGYHPPANVANVWAEPYCPDGVTMWDGAMLRNCAAELHYGWLLVPLSAQMRRRCFPNGETTGRMISAPTQTYRIVHGA